MPKLKATVHSRCQQFPGEGLEVIKSQLKCTFCNIFVNYEKKSALASHLKSKSHFKCKDEFRRKKVTAGSPAGQSGGQEQWTFLVQILFGAGIPLTILENEDFRHWMSKYAVIGSSFPPSKTLKAMVEKGYIDPEAGTERSIHSTCNKNSKTIDDILCKECAHCAVLIRIEEKPGTKLGTNIQFLNSELETGLFQEITHFQAICEIYGILPGRLNRSVKRHLMTLTNESGITFGSQAEETSFIKGLISLNLTLCQNCSKTLTELYSLHHRFVKLLSKEDSILSKSVGDAKTNDFIKLENVSDVETDSNQDDLAFKHTNNERLDEMNKTQIKEEIIDSDCSYTENNSIFDDNNGEEATKEFVQATTKPTSDNTDKRNYIAQNGTARKTRQNTVRSLLKRGKEKESCESSDEFSPSDECATTFRKCKRQNPSGLKRRSSNAIVKRVKKHARLIYARQKQSDKKDYSDNVSDANDTKLETKNTTADVMFNSKRKPKQHYGCRICFEDFQTNHKLKMHRLTHFGEPLKVTHHVKGPPYVCPSCPKSYKSLMSLQFHAAIAHRLKVPGKFDHVSAGWNCEDCEEAFEDPEKIQIHYESVHNRKYFCRYCYIAFISQTELNVHTITVHKKPGVELKFKPALKVKWRSKLIAKKSPKLPVEHFPCKKCGKVFSTPYKRKIHKLMHIDGVQITTETIKGPPFTCPRCDKPYKSFVCFNEHSIIRHKVKYPSTVTRFCTKCNLEFSNTIDLEDHCRSVHGIEYFCKYCNKYFTAAASLLLHEASHEEKAEKYLHADIATEELKDDEPTIFPTSGTEKTIPRAFRCRSCKQVFESYKLAKIHERMHKTGEIVKQGVTCEVCGKYFQNRSDLFSHKYTHTTLKPHMCEKCGRSFKRRTDLTKHAVDHEQVEKGITCQCELCGKTLKHSTSLRRHISRFHRGKRKPECPRCHKSFSNRYNVRIHLKICKSVSTPKSPTIDVINQEVNVDLPSDMNCSMEILHNTSEFGD